MASAFGRIGDTLKTLETKLGETHKAAVTSFEETFEIRGGKSQAQIELEAWNARVDEERARSQAAVSQVEGNSPEFEERNEVFARHPSADDPETLIGDRPARSLITTDLDPAAAAAAAMALRQVRTNMNTTFKSDDQASATDKVIHQQRVQLIALRKERESFERERAQMQAQKQVQGLQGLLKADGPGVESPVPIGTDGSVKVERANELLAQIWRVPPRRFIALVVVALRMQRSLDRSVSADAEGWDLRVERSEMEKLVGDLMRDRALLVKSKRDGNSTAPSKRMERHLETVQKMLSSIHHRHLQSRDKVHQALSRQNEQLAAELAALKMQIGQLQAGNSTASRGSRVALGSTSMRRLR